MKIKNNNTKGSTLHDEECMPEDYDVTFDEQDGIATVRQEVGRALAEKYPAIEILEGDSGDAEGTGSPARGNTEDYGSSSAPSVEDDPESTASPDPEPQTDPENPPADADGEEVDAETADSVADQTTDDADNEDDS